LVYHNAAGIEPEGGSYEFVIEQGDFIDRPSRINLSIKGEPGAVEEVKVGGSSVVVLRGELLL
jgi:predicted PhzF superfamily epimerase YddE/YHI9